MKKIAIIFSNSPYGKYLGKEGLNIALSVSCYTENLGIFFIGDGVFQILSNQKPHTILSKPYCSVFDILTVNNINNFYLCYDSLLQRGLHKNIHFTINVNILNFTQIKCKMKKFDIILNF